MQPSIAVYYEHPEWFEPMFRELDRRGVAYERLLATEHHFDPSDHIPPYDLVVNRMSPSAFTRGHEDLIPYTLQYLAHLDAIGAQVVNGYEPYTYEFSKARQLGVLARLGLRHPRAQVIHHPGQAPAAAADLVFPVVVKPNIGGSGAGIRRFDTPEQLADAAARGDFDLGLDQMGLVQEYHRPADGSIVRVEILDGQLLYAIRLHLETPDSFNLCPADYCRVPTASENGSAGPAPSPDFVPIESYDPPAHVVESVTKIARATGIEVGGVEYLVSERDEETYYYDINALSNFVADPLNVIGFDPFTVFVDYLLARVGA